MIKRSLFVKNKIALGLAAATLGLSSTSLHAANFELGDFDIRFDSNFSYGQSIRVERTEFQRGKGPTQPAVPVSSRQHQRPSNCDSKGKARCRSIVDLAPSMQNTGLARV